MPAGGGGTEKPLRVFGGGGGGGGPGGVGAADIGNGGGGGGGGGAGGGGAALTEPSFTEFPDRGNREEIISPFRSVGSIKSPLISKQATQCYRYTLCTEFCIEVTMNLATE